jgi:protoporphyrinogen oxidase
MSKEKRALKVQTSLIEEFHYPKYGPGQLWETVAREVEAMGGQVLLHREVTGIDTEGGAVKAVRVKGENGEEVLAADLFFSSMPVRDLVAGMNAAPQEVKRVAKGLPYRDFVTVGILVNKLHIFNQTHLKTLGNIVPDCWIYVQDTNVKLGRIQIFNNWSPYMVKDPENTVWMGLEYFCDEGDEFWSMPEEKCVAMATKELITMGLLKDPSEVLDSHRERVQKAYPAYFDTYSEMDVVTEYLSGLENLYCVGRNGQHRYNNMDHSMATSFEAVKNILGNVKTKDNVWKVNTEQEYHEEKKTTN